MGTDKAFVEVAGRPLIDWVIAALTPVCSEIVIAGRPDGIGPVPGIGDPIAERRGPLSGVAAALEHAGQGTVLVVAVDQPWIRSETLEHLAEVESELAVVPVDSSGVRQTTCARYPTSMLPVALDELLAGGSIQSVVDRTAFVPIGPDLWRGWGEDGRSWYSVDTPDAVAQGLEKFGEPS